jgi:hypothetical protein
VQSILTDAETLLAHPEHWVVEEKRSTVPCRQLMRPVRIIASGEILLGGTTRGAAV